MSGMRSYYLSRLAIAAAFGALFVLTGSPVLLGVLVAALGFAWFLVAPRIGRYTVRPGSGAVALSLDERGRAIRDSAARNAFVVCMLALGAVILYFHAQALPSVPTDVLLWVLVLGALVYYVSDFWVRRAQS